MIRATILSHFDPIQGPSILATVPAFGKDETRVFEAVPKLIDVADVEQFFMSTLQGIYCANYYFKLEAPAIRGRFRLLLASLAFEPGPLDDKDAALRFLTGMEPVLRAAVDKIKTHEPFKILGLLAPENEPALKDMLHALHEAAFSTALASSMTGTESTGKIVVLGTAGIDAKKVVQDLITRVASEPKRDLKTRLVLNAASELLFVDFDCIERGAPTCWNDRCPGCKGLAAESDAAIIVYDPATLDDDATRDIIDYVASIEANREIPLLLLAAQGVEPVPAAGTPHLLDEQAIASKVGITGKIKHFTISLLDAAPFKQALATLVKLLI